MNYGILPSVASGYGLLSQPQTQQVQTAQNGSTGAQSGGQSSAANQSQSMVNQLLNAGSGSNATSNGSNSSQSSGIDASSLSSLYSQPLTTNAAKSGTFLSGSTGSPVGSTDTSGSSGSTGSDSTSWISKLLSSILQNNGAQ